MSWCRRSMFYACAGAGACFVPCDVCVCVCVWGLLSEAIFVCSSVRCYAQNHFCFYCYFSFLRPKNTVISCKIVIVMLCENGHPVCSVSMQRTKCIVLWTEWEFMARKSLRDKCWMVKGRERDGLNAKRQRLGSLLENGMQKANDLIAAQVTNVNSDAKRKEKKI